MRLSFLLTAAGQFRIYTGFPFSTAMQNKLYRQLLHYSKEARSESEDTERAEGRRRACSPVGKKTVRLKTSAIAHRARTAVPAARTTAAAAVELFFLRGVQN